jgi:two-component system KDP operon response regulator KdpE
MDKITTATNTGDRNGRIRGITNLDEELGLSGALRRALSMSGLDYVACSTPTVTLLSLDGQVIEAVLMPLIFAVSVREHELDSATRGGPHNRIVKAPRLPELAAHIKAVLRRAELRDAKTSETISIRDIELDPSRRTVRKRDHILHLSPKEFDLLHFLMARAGVPVRHAELLRKIWGAEYGQELEYLRTYIYQLRQKLEDNPTVPRHLLTLPHFGYRFVDSEAHRMGSGAA